MKSCQYNRFGRSAPSTTPRTPFRTHGRLNPGRYFVARAETSRTQENDMLPFSESDLDSWPAIEDLEQLQDDVSLLDSLVDDMDETIDEEEVEEEENEATTAEDIDGDDDEGPLPAHKTESSWDGLEELPDQESLEDSGGSVWKGRQQQQSLQEGLKFVDQAEKEVRAEEELMEMLEAVQKRKNEQEVLKRRVAWGESKKKDRMKLLSEMEIVEDSPERAEFHKMLFSAAKKGKPALAEMTIQDMFSAAVLPGPKAYHGVIFAYVKAEDPEGALGAIRRAHNAGVVPITESYLILIHSFIKDGNVKTAEAILASMKRAGADAYRGWTMMIKSLLGEGNLTAAKQHLKLGKEHGWWPDSELYEVLMQDLCNRKLSYQAKRLMSEIEKRIGTITLKHATPYLDLISRAERTTLKAVLKTYSRIEDPNLIMYNALLRAYLRNWTGSRDESKSFMRTWVQMNNNYVPSMASHILMLRAQLNMNNVSEAADMLIESKVCSCIGEDRKNLVDTILPDLLRGLSEANQPIALTRVLQALSLDGCDLTGDSMTTNANGSTFVTMWLEDHLANMQRRLESGNKGDKPVIEMGTRIFRYADYEVDLGFCNCAVDSEGVILPVSKMSGLQMAAELESRGVGTEGMPRPELAREIRISRSAWPAIADEIRRKRRLKSRKTRMMRDEQEARLKDVIGPPERYETDSNADSITYGSGQIAESKNLTKEDITQQLEDAILDAEARNTARAQQAAAKAAEEAAIRNEKNPAKQKPATKGNFEPSPAEGFGSSGEDSAVSIPAPKEPTTEVWQDTLELDSAFGSAKDQTGTAGVMTAVKICELLQSMAQVCTLEDFELIVEGIYIEESPASALAMAKLIGKVVTTVSLPSLTWKAENVSKQAKQIAYKERLSMAFTKCARICLDQGYPDSSAEVLKIMVESGMTPPDELVASVQKKRGPSAPIAPTMVKALAPAPQIAGEATNQLTVEGQDTTSENGEAKIDADGKLLSG